MSVAAWNSRDSVTCHWEKKTSRYDKNSDALDRLAGENAKHF
ncbi:hypothetical protein [Mesorhizobium sp. M0830]